MASNLVPLDLACFSLADAAKIEALQKKTCMMRRWCRCDRVEENGQELYLLYSGDNGPAPYVTYRVSRRPDGSYVLENGNKTLKIATGQTIDVVLKALPQNFFFTEYQTGRT